MPVGDDLRADLSRRRGGALGEVLDPSSEKETQEIIFGPDILLFITLSWSVSRNWKIIENVSFYIASEASYVYILSWQKFTKNAKNSLLGEFLKRSNSVTKYAIFNSTKICGKCQNK